MELTRDILTASDGKKKGGGVSAILGLMKDIVDFQGKIEACAEAQDIAENRNKIEEFGEYISGMWEACSGIANGSIRSIRKSDDHPLADVLDTGEEEVEVGIAQEHTPSSVQTPTRPTM